MSEAELEAIKFELTTGTSIELKFGDTRPPRRCGTCSLCCKLLPVTELGKPGGKRCTHQRHSGCRIYGQRGFPSGCAFWSCRWLLDQELPDRPDRSHLVVDIMPDTIIAVDEDGARKQHSVLQVWADPAFPDAHRAKPFRDWLEDQARITGCAALIRFGADAGDGILLIPPPLLARYEWREVPCAHGPGVGLWTGAKADELRPDRPQGAPAPAAG